MRRALYIRLAAFVLGAGLAAAPFQAFAFSRVKDLVEVEGIRDNMLVGYGLVVGLNGTGDSLKNAPFTQQSLQTMLERLGVNTRGTTMQTKNVAAVMVTANLPAFAAPGHPHRRLGQRHGRCQESAGRHLAGDDRCSAPTARSMPSARARSRSAASRPAATAASVTRGVPTAGRISNGAIVEREIGFTLASRTHSATVAAQSRPDHRHAHRRARSTPIWAATVAEATDPSTMSR